MPCPECGYDLRGVPEPVCPECGTDVGSLPLDPVGAPTTERAERRVLLLASLGFFVSAACALGFHWVNAQVSQSVRAYYFQDPRPAWPVGAWIAAANYLVPLTLLGAVAWRLARTTAARREWVSPRGASRLLATFWVAGVAAWIVPTLVLLWFVIVVLPVLS
ncbi:MAG: hypothetical protein R3B57_00540 [Phycisphaerales bacterium]